MSYTDKIRKQALIWSIKGYDLITIAQHFGLHVEELKQLLNNVER